MNQTATEERSWQTFPESPVAIYIAGFATGISLVVSCITVNRHLVHWSKPRTQGQIIRIVLVCPIYALASLLSLVVSEAASVYVETVRDLFEAFVIYTFLALVLEYAGGEAACVAKICHLPPLRHPLGPCLARLLPAMPRNHVLLRKCKQGTLQFVLVKPLMAFTGLIAALAGAYSDPTYQACVLLVYNVSYTLALYWLFVVYLATKSVIARHSPVAKFVAVKGIVFATYTTSRSGARGVGDEAEPPAPRPQVLPVARRRVLPRAPARGRHALERLHPLRRDDRLRGPHYARVLVARVRDGRARQALAREPQGRRERARRRAGHPPQLRADVPGARASGEYSLGVASSV